MKAGQNSNGASQSSPTNQTSQLAAFNQEYFQLEEKNQQVSRNLDNRFDPNNMTFSEAQQTNYQNLEEFQIQQQQLKNQQPTSEPSHKNAEQSVLSPTAQSYQNQGNPEEQVPKVPFLSLEQRLMSELQAQLDQNNQLLSPQGSNAQNDEKSISMVSSVNNTQRSQYPIEIIQQSNKAKIVMNKLKNKGQIKIHRGLKKNNYLVNSKQNSQPQRQLGQNSQNQSNQNNNIATISHLNFNKQRSSLGPHQMSVISGTPMTRNNKVDDSEASQSVHIKNVKQILQTKSNNSSLVSKGMVLKANNLSNNNVGLKNYVYDSNNQI